MFHQVELPTHVLRSLLHTGRATYTLPRAVKLNVNDVLGHGEGYKDEYFARVETLRDTCTIELVYLGGGEIRGLFKS